jgi:hypothetical protein
MVLAPLAAQLIPRPIPEDAAVPARKGARK